MHPDEFASAALRRSPRRAEVAALGASSILSSAYEVAAAGPAAGAGALYEKLRELQEAFYSALSLHEKGIEGI